MPEQKTAHTLTSYIGVGLSAVMSTSNHLCVRDIAVGGVCVSNIGSIGAQITAKSRRPVCPTWESASAQLQRHQDPHPTRYSWPSRPRLPSGARSTLFWFCSCCATSGKAEVPPVGISSIPGTGAAGRHALLPNLSQLSRSHRGRTPQNRRVYI